MNTPSPELIAYIGKELHAGVLAETITQALLAAEWSKEDIETAFRANGVEHVISQPAISAKGTNITSPTTSTVRLTASALFALIIIVVLTSSYFVIYPKWKERALPTQESLTKTVQSSTTTVSFPDFNTKVTKLLDLSPYNMVESEKLWSEVSYFQFDGNGWIASVPLTKTTGAEATFVIGFADGSVREVKEQFQISANGAFLIAAEMKGGADKKSILKKYVVSDSLTGKVISTTPYVDTVYRLVLTREGDIHIVALQDQKLSWFQNETVVEQFPLSEAYTTNQKAMEHLVDLGFGSNPAYIAFVKRTPDGAESRIVSSDGLFTAHPKWNYPEDPLKVAGLLAVSSPKEIMTGMYGTKQGHVYLNEFASLPNVNLVDFNAKHYRNPNPESGTQMLFFLDKDGKNENERAGAWVAEDDGKNQPFLLILEDDGTYTKGKKYPKGTKMSNLTFGNDGTHVRYVVEIPSVDSNNETYYVVSDGKEEGPWTNVSSLTESENGDYLYHAVAADKSTVVVRNGQPVLSISQGSLIEKDGQQTMDNNIDGFTLNDFAGINQNPKTGDPLFVLTKTVFYNDTDATTTERKSIISLGKMETKSKVIYQGKELGIYDGHVTSVNWGQDIFSPDGKHYAYLVDGEGGTKDILVIDGKELPIDGDLLGAWSGKSGGFSSDSNWFGLYIMKNNVVWWTPYNLNDPHEIKIPS